jgi:hypothetical protein
VVLNHSPKRYELEKPTDQVQLLVARIADTPALFHHKNNYFMRNRKVYEMLKGLCRKGLAAEYVNIPFIAQAKDGRSA